MEINQGLPCVHIHDAQGAELQAGFYSMLEGWVAFRPGDAGAIEDKVVSADFKVNLEEVTAFLSVATLAKVHARPARVPMFILYRLKYDETTKYDRLRLSVQCRPMRI